MNVHNSMNDTDPSVGDNFQPLVSDLPKEGSSNSINNQEQHLVHFNPTFEGNSAINVVVKEGVLEATNHSVVVFKNNSKMESVSKGSRGSVCIPKIDLSRGVSNRQNFNAKASSSKGGPGNHFKNSDNPQVHFADSMKKVAELIASEFDGISAKEFLKKIGGHEEAGCTSDKFLRAVREYNNLDKPDVVSLLELRTRSKSPFQQEVLICNELENILHHEEMLWKHKSRCEWLNLGDHSTSYFHRRTIMRRKFNKITALRNADGEWTFNSEALKTEAVIFFQQLYGENPSSSRPLPSNHFPRLNLEYVKSLRKGITNEEIKTALFDMAPFKTPSSDCFQAAFFQNQWDNIRGTICEWAKKVFEGGTIDPKFNNTLIVLIPKVPNLENFSQFRPIRLCSVLYKLVMKIIANRFKSIFPKIIGQEQASFIAGRSIIDNVIIA
ncbi:hypothetical protein J1N35_011231 [Gossypium stocksii]|uniref:Reverse transcriptase domain-containing protein n=1 Tax=Gossypium stocksii TaxID=47602 RepID=A0A9D3W3V2_9ROSI|nr:hypothetical protein J1N35_011231 [Gossypium stocksii]